MFLVSVYFDDGTNRRIQGYMDAIAKSSGNTFMIDGNVPPHITLTAFETRNEEDAVQMLENAAREMEAGRIIWCSVGAFFPYVIYLAPVLNEYLHGLSQRVYEQVIQMEDTKISRFYRPFQWIPHTTVGKKLSEHEMAEAFTVLQKTFTVFEGEVVRIGLARTNPYRELVSIELAE